jgi:hypothetical protein
MTVDLTEGLLLDDPPVRVPWSVRRSLLAATLPPELARRREAPRAHFGDEWTALVGVFGARWRLVLELAPEIVGGRLRSFWLEPPPESWAGPFDGRPPTLAEQVARHGAAMLERRAKLEAALGPAALEPNRVAGVPCATAHWTCVRATVMHEISWIVERGGDEDGWLEDRVRIAPGA